MQKVDGEVLIDSIISIGDADVLVDWLNFLHDENEQLKQQRDFYYARLQKIIKVANGDLE